MHSPWLGLTSYSIKAGDEQISALPPPAPAFTSVLACSSHVPDALSPLSPPIGWDWLLLSNSLISLPVVPSPPPHSHFVLKTQLVPLRSQLGLGKPSD